MALGAQKSPTQTLVTLALWAKRKGYQVGEMHGFSAVHRVHTANSWHYDKDSSGYGKAADFNWPGGGNTERLKLITLTNKAKELGLGMIYARYGIYGPASGHRGHAHVDVSGYVNLGARVQMVSGGGDQLTEDLQGAVRTKKDQIWGPGTNKRLVAVRSAAKGKFPYGKAYVQRVVGVHDDGIWGPKSKAAHADMVANIQRALKRAGKYSYAIDGKWGAGTERGFNNARDLRWRR